jgi:hypothetical protein
MSLENKKKKHKQFVIYGARYFCQILKEFGFCRQIFVYESPAMSNFMEIRPVRANLTQADIIITVALLIFV